MLNGVLGPRGTTHSSGDRAAKTTLQGVRRQDWPVRPEAARRLGRELAYCGQIAYWVATSEKHPLDGKGVEQRGGRREPMRLRSAKLLDATYRFVCDCRICDQSPNGLRLALARNVGIPPRLAVHIDETMEVRDAQLIWRRGLLVGIRMHGKAPTEALRPSDRYALRERYYAVLD